MTYYISNKDLEGQTWSALANDNSDAIIKAGGIPVIIPITNDQDYLKDLAEKLDGLYISGGNDIDPLLFNMRADKYTGNMSPERDQEELYLIDYFYKNTKKPILGICRGMQILNVYFKGDLILDIPNAGYPTHSINKMDRSYLVNKVEIEKDSLLYEILGKETSMVNSLHHQGVNKLGDRLRAVAKSEDGIIEAFEHQDIKDRFILGIQFHPEMTSIKDMDHQKIFDYFVEMAKK